MRYSFGASLEGFLVSAQDAAAQYGTGALVARMAPNTPVTFWSAQTSGTQHTDLLNTLGAAATSITTDANGFIPLFSGPDPSPPTMWADAGAGRALIRANDLPQEPVLYYDSVAGDFPERPVDATRRYGFAGPTFPDGVALGAQDGDWLRLEPA